MWHALAVYFKHFKISVMKKIFVHLIVAIIVLVATPAHAQSKPGSTAGLYLSSTDFRDQKLTYQIDCNSNGDKIRTNEFLGSSSGYVLVNGQKHVFDKNKVYGYRSCRNKSYRFYKGEAYELLDTAGFYIYYLYRPEVVNKGKGLVKTDEYFFSIHSDSGLKPLTIVELKNAFPTNQNFHYALDSYFRSDKELIAYDSFKKEYKVKHLFNQSIN